MSVGSVSSHDAVHTVTLAWGSLHLLSHVTVSNICITLGWRDIIELLGIKLIILLWFLRSLENQSAELREVFQWQPAPFLQSRETNRKINSLLLRTVHYNGLPHRPCPSEPVPHVRWNGTADTEGVRAHWSQEFSLVHRHMQKSRDTELRLNVSRSVPQLLTWTIYGSLLYLWAWTVWSSISTSGLYEDDYLYCMGQSEESLLMI